MKIGCFYPPFYPATSGSSVHGYCLIEALKRRGHEILSCLGDRSPGTINFSRNWSGALRLAMAADVLYIRVSARSPFTKATLLKYIRPFSLPIVWELDAPIEELSATLPDYPGIEHIIKREKLKLKLYGKFVNAAIGVSALLQDYIRSELNIKNAHAIPNGSTPQAFDPPGIKKTVLEQFPEKFKVCWAGDARISWQAVDLIIHIARQMEQTDPDILFVIICGESAYEFPVLSNLLVLRQVSFSDLPHYLAAVDACLCLYRDHAMGFYNSPLKLFDYMAAGKPLIASSLGQLAEIIRHGTNGLLTDNTVKTTADQLKTLKGSPDLRQRLGANARQDAVGYYNWDRVALETEKVLQDTITAKLLRYRTGKNT